MARDDYYVLVGKILGYLYLKLKHKAKKGIEYLSPMTSDFPIEQDYFDYVMLHLLQDGYIEGVTVMRTWGGEVIMYEIPETVCITPKGIDYLRENDTLHKILEKLPEFAGLASLFAI